jgi:type II secretory pathway component PulF
MNALFNRLFAIWKVTRVVLFLLFASFNVFVAVFIIPRFEQIFQDALPGQPLPKLTQLIIFDRFSLTAFASILLVLGIFSVRRKQDNWCAFLLFVMSVQIGITIVALFMPMVVDITGMSSQAKSL